jgi:hypothetical protein
LIAQGGLQAAFSFSAYRLGENPPNNLPLM